MGSKREGVMLAYSVDEKKLSKMPDVVLFQRKLNGERARIEWTLEGEPRIISSCGNEMPFLNHIKEELINKKLYNLKLDGELYSHGLSREETHSIVSRRTKKNFDEKKIEFHVFDLIEENTDQYNRITSLKNLGLDNNTSVKLVQTELANKSSLLDFADIYIKEGYEGIIVRHPNALYTPRKCNFMLKYKPSSEDTYKIIGYEEEISIHGEAKDTLGAVIVIDTDNRVFSVGTGKALTKESRQYWWSRRESLKGMYARVKHSEILTVNNIPTCTSLIELVITKENS
jgi:ATP-dependent DNA ligase